MAMQLIRPNLLCIGDIHDNGRFLDEVTPQLMAKKNSEKKTWHYQGKGSFICSTRDRKRGSWYTGLNLLNPVRI